MTQGGREDIPQPMMGGMPPDMGGGLGAMMPQQSAPMPPPDMGGMPPDMGGMSPDMMMAEQIPMQEEPMPMQEKQGSIEEDSVQLAGAVMERAGDDPQTAVAILEGAAGLIMQSVQQEPMMAASGKYMKPKYAAEGEYLGEESDTLRQMIMDRIQNSPITSMADVTRGQGMILNEGDLRGMGRIMFDAEKDTALKGFNDKVMEEIRGIPDYLRPETPREEKNAEELFWEAYEANPDAFSQDAEYYNMLQDQQDLEKLIEERRK